jgi:hypothetical protein
MLTTVRVAAVRTLSALHYIDPELTKTKLIPVFYALLTNQDAAEELRDAALEALDTVVQHNQPDEQWVSFKEFLRDDIKVLNSVFFLGLWMQIYSCFNVCRFCDKMNPIFLFSFAVGLWMQIWSCLLVGRFCDKLDPHFSF